MRQCRMKRRKLASAIGYSPEDPAPRVLASGRDREAEHIIAVAREAGVVIVEDEALAALLDSSTGPGDFIPLWCWEAVAKILIFVTKGDS
jgi:flagellar biosynthesis protein